MRFNVVDIETTGLSYETDEIVEIAAVKFDGPKEIGRISFLVKPKKPLTEENLEALAINKIDPKDLEGKPSIEEVLPKIAEFCGDDVVIGHNFKDFDFNFINEATLKGELEPIRGEVFCSLKIARLALEKFKHVVNHKLETLIKFYEIPVDETKLHRAVHDCYYNGLVFWKLMESLGIKDMEGLYRQQAPWKFKKPSEQRLLF